MSESEREAQEAIRRALEEKRTIEAQQAELRSKSQAKGGRKKDTDTTNSGGPRRTDGDDDAD